MDEQMPLRSALFSELQLTLSEEGSALLPHSVKDATDPLPKSASSDMPPQFLRVFAERRYRHTATVSHQGKVIAFAMDEARHFFYVVLDLERGDVTPSEGEPSEDGGHWDRDAQELEFPRELDRVGYDVGGPFPMPVVTLSGSVAVDGSPVEEKDLDRFRSSTARLTADAPFQALSDGHYVHLCRQSIGKDHPDMAYVRHWDGSQTPAVDDSLLIDSFVLVENRLRCKREVRFQRSRNRSFPAGTKDTLGPQDLENAAFHQPTHELPFLRHLKDGRFALLLAPTALPEVQRWLIFACNESKNAIEVFSLEQAADGSFDTRGTRYYTCPTHPANVFEPKPGLCPVDGKDSLVPVEGQRGAAGNCLFFQSTGAYVSCGERIDLRKTSFTIEAWARRHPQASDESWLLGLGKENNKDKHLHIGFRKNGTFTFSFYADDVDVTDYPTTGWNHWACVYDAAARQQRVYCNGRLVGQRSQPAAFDGEGELRIGARGSADPGAFDGWIDEVRIWDRVRSQAEIQADMHFLLVGREPGLVAYWRFDEAAGTEVRDWTDNDHKGALNGNVTRQSSHAPLGVHPGIQHSLIGFAGLKIASAPAAVLYAQQEQAAAGYDHSSEPVKRAVRVMLSVAVQKMTGQPSHLVALDFGLSRLGMLPQLLETVDLPVLPDAGKQAAMPLLDVDRNGLSVYGALLGFAGVDTGTGPCLFDAANGRVNLYFRGKENRFCAAHYDTSAARARFSLPAPGGGRPVVLVARAAGPSLDDAVIEVSDIGKPDRCKVTISLKKPARTETWAEVPRDPQRLAEALNGLDPTVWETVGKLTKEVNGKVTEVELAAGLAKALAAGTVLTIGQTRVKLAKAAAAQDKKLTLVEHELKAAAGSFVKILDQHGGVASRFFHADASQASGAVAFGKAARDGAPTPTAGCLWVADGPGTAFLFNPDEPKTKSVILGVQGREAARFSRRDHLTLEAWVRPDKNTGERSLLVHDDGKQGCSLELGRAPALRFNGTSDYVKVPFHQDLAPAGFTLCAWAMVTAGDGGYRSVVTARKTAEMKGFALYADPTEKWIFMIGTGQAFWTDAPFDADAVKNQWIHLAVTVSGKEVVTYVNGAKPKKTTLSKDYAPNPGGDLLIGTGEGLSFFFPGGIDEVRLWKTVLTQEQLKDQWQRRLTAQERLNENLVGYWYFGEAERSVPNRAGRPHLAGEVVGNPTAIPSPLGDSIPFAVVGDRLIRSSKRLPVQRWSHLAAVYEQGYALQFRGPQTWGGDYVDCGNGQSLDLTEDLTLEAWVLRGTMLHHHAAILGKGVVDTPDGRERMPYALWLEGLSYKIVFAFTDEKGVLHQFSSTQPVPPNSFHHVAVTRERVTTAAMFQIDDEVLKKLEAQRVPKPVRDKVAPLTNKYPDKRSFLRALRPLLGQVAQGPGFEASIVNAARKAVQGDASGWIEITFFLDGQEVGFEKYAGDRPGSSLQLFTIGRCTTGDTVYKRTHDHFTGAIAEVRVWSVARDDRALGSPLHGSEQGLVSWWRFKEGKGRDLADFGGLNNGTCHGPAWKACTEFSRLETYVDGEVDRQALRSVQERPANILPQLTLGARLMTEGADRRLAGQMDEVRVWSVARTAQQIRENLFRPLSDEREHLLGYFDGEATGTAQVRDRSAYGHHLQASSPTKVARFKTSADYVHFIQRPKADTWELWFKPDPTASGPAPLVFLSDMLRADWDGAKKEVRVGACFFDPQSKKPQWLTVGQTGIDPSSWCHVAGAAIGRTLYLAVNGVLVATRRAGGPYQPAPTGAWYLATDQKQSFKGWMKELRLWQTESFDLSRIRDGLYKPLQGNELKLTGYWPLDKIENGKLKDRTVYQNHGTPAPSVTLEEQFRYIMDPAVLALLYADSTAPVATDAPKVRSVLARVDTEFHDTVESRPSVQEYGSLEIDSEGTPGAVLKRCYSYLKGGAWHLLTGFKVSDLDVEWIGQVQTRPQLIGFIEGAPPVPSENFRGNTDYTNACSVELTEAEEVRQSYTLSDTKSREFKLEGKASMGGKSKTLANLLAVLTTAEEVEITAGMKSNLTLSSNWVRLNQETLGTDRNQLSRIGLTGDSGTSFSPHNVGFALVKSETADLYAFRIRHPKPEKRSMVAFFTRPNPNIPKDWNVLVFQMNPFYTKQGVLDGKVGLSFDPHYAKALQGGVRENSFFKPVEAYALKSRIAREEEQLRILYQSFDTGETGPRMSALGEAASAGLEGGTASLNLVQTGYQFSTLAAQRLPEPWKRNMVNTYLWTADGGLFQETERTMDVRQEVYKGEWAMSFGLGAFLNMDVTFSKVNVELAIEAMATGGYKLNVEKSATSQTSFGIDVSFSDGLWDRGKPKDGEVNAFRFMTFYLAPSKDHADDFFHKVVNPEWLAGPDPNAVALRQARGAGAAPWRVLHRVTFVSRVVPKVGKPLDDPLDGALRIAHVESNYELLRMLGPLVQDKVKDYAAFRDAAREAIRRYLPELDQKDVRERVVDYLCYYYEVFPAQ
jgi:hypothetical protein